MPCAEPGVLRCSFQLPPILELFAFGVVGTVLISDSIKTGSIFWRIPAKISKFELIRSNITSLHSCSSSIFSSLSRLFVANEDYYVWNEHQTFITIYLWILPLMCCNFTTLEITDSMWSECRWTARLNAGCAEYKFRDAFDGNAFMFFVAATMSAIPSCFCHINR